MEVFGNLWELTKAKITIQGGFVSSDNRSDASTEKASVPSLREIHELVQLKRKYVNRKCVPVFL
jgi:hypothetical protein